MASQQEAEPVMTPEPAQNKRRRALQASAALTSTPNNDPKPTQSDSSDCKIASEIQLSGLSSNQSDIDIINRAMDEVCGAVTDTLRSEPTDGSDLAALVSACDGFEASEMLQASGDSCLYEAGGQKTFEPVKLKNLSQKVLYNVNGKILKLEALSVIELVKIKAQKLLIRECLQKQTSIPSLVSLSKKVAEGPIPCAKIFSEIDQALTTSIRFKAVSSLDTLLTPSMKTLKRKRNCD